MKRFNTVFQKQKVKHKISKQKQSHVKKKRKWTKKCSSVRTEIPLRIPSHFLRRNHQNTVREGTKPKKSENKGKQFLAPPASEDAFTCLLPKCMLCTLPLKSNKQYAFLLLCFYSCLFILF